VRSTALVLFASFGIVATPAVASAHGTAVDTARGFVQTIAPPILAPKLIKTADLQRESAELLKKVDSGLVLSFIAHGNCFLGTCELLSSTDAKSAQEKRSLVNLALAQMRALGLLGGEFGNIILKAEPDFERRWPKAEWINWSACKNYDDRLVRCSARYDGLPQPLPGVIANFQVHQKQLIALTFLMTSQDRIASAKALKASFSNRAGG
jgi:hypothetical protein